MNEHGEVTIRIYRCVAEDGSKKERDDGEGASYEIRVRKEPENSDVRNQIKIPIKVQNLINRSSVNKKNPSNKISLESGRVAVTGSDPDAVNQSILLVCEHHPCSGQGRCKSQNSEGNLRQKEDFVGFQRWANSSCHYL